MKSVSFLPKSWKKLKHPSNARDISDPYRDRSTYSRPLTTSPNSTSSTLVEPLPQSKRSVSVDREEDPRNGSPSTHFPKVARPSTAPHGSSRRSRTLPVDKGYVRLRAPSDASWTVVGRPPIQRLHTSDTASLASQSSSNVSLLIPRAPKLSPAAAKFRSLDRHHSSSPVSTSSSRTIRVKNSMPELDGVWKGFLEEVNENVDSIRLDLESVDARGHLRDSDALRPVEASIPTPVSAVPLSVSPTSSRLRGGSHSSNPHKCPVSEFSRVNKSTCDNYTLISDARKRSLSPLLSPPFPSHNRDPSAEFPLSLFPIPPPLHTPPARNRVPSDISAPLMASAVEANSPLKSKPPPRSPARKNVPHPLDVRLGPRDVPSSPNLDSPPSSTPTTPRSPQSLPLPTLRTASSVSTLKVKSTGGPGGHSFITPLPSPPTTPDYYRNMSTTPELAEPYRSEKPPERPSLRSAYSSSQLRGYSTPPPGAHRATMSESVNPSGGGRTPSRPLLVTTAQHGHLEADAYLYPRPAPDPAPHHVQWGYAV